MSGFNDGAPSLCWHVRWIQPGAGGSEVLGSISSRTEEGKVADRGTENEGAGKRGFERRDQL